jgi:hypothetical protein
LDCATQEGHAALPESYKALPLTDSMDENWMNLMTENVWYKEE